MTHGITCVITCVITRDMTHVITSVITYGITYAPRNEDKMALRFTGIANFMGK